MQCGLATMGNSLIILYKARCTHISYTSNSTLRNLFQQNKNIPPNEISPHISIQVLFIVFKKLEAIHMFISGKWKLKVVCPVGGTVGRRSRELSMGLQWQIPKLLHKVKETRHKSLPPLLRGVPEMAKLHGAKPVHWFSGFRVGQL